MTDGNRFYADTCDHCLRPARPGSGIATGGLLTAAYRCCGTTWTCTWRIVPGRILPPQPRLNAA
ncbi:hypothetical protein QNO07_09565 [Streptomyces sp. 549]|uniref:hypothetical protein n=1 Tax=Streptomyces sp. 549 TaxID=3049076 RepID=UPI0024C25C9F|nr:hypothetical protein [Streptomyces sp. 549]MDK1473667.1 hypothetical protein [Streptomyces sp. 549]